MLPIPLFSISSQRRHLFAAAPIVLALAACGGGGGNPGAVSGTGGTGTTVVDPATLEPKAEVTLTNSSGAAINNLSGAQSGIVRVKVLDTAGKPAANAIVKFAGDTSLISFTPESASALTDANGVATIIVKPASFSAAGALQISASAVVGTKTATGSVNVAIGASTAPAETAEISLIDSKGAAINSLSGSQIGTVRVRVLDSAGKPAPNAIAKFTADTSLIAFTPESASALTDANGIATIAIKPVSVVSAGALQIGVSVAIGSKTTTASINLAVGAAPLTLGELSFVPAPTGKLPAYSSASLAIPITSGGQPSTASTGLSVSSLCASSGAATLVPGAISNGVVTAVYTNNGCLLGTDVITVGLGNSTKTISIDVDAANIGTIQFVSSDLAGSSIVLRGSGGLGRKESALLTYRVLDQNNRGLAGVNVSFRATTNTGGLTVQPDSGTTDANGQVTTTVSSGTIPTPVRVIAEASRNGKTISGMSDSLVISTGLPTQRALSLSSDSYNIEGWDVDGATANLTVRLADQYGNPISDNAAVNFVTEGGAVGSSAQGACTTIDGGCTVKLRSQNFRPINGRVSVLTYVQGVENFTDSNGDGQYSCTNYADANGAVPAVYRPLVDTCLSGGEPFTDQGDPFLDVGTLTVQSGMRATGTLDGVYEAAKGDLPIPYNSTTFNATGNGKWGINYISAQREFVFSGSTASLVRMVCSSTGTCRDWTNADGDMRTIAGLSGSSCSAKTLTFRIRDVNNNPMPKDSVVATADAEKVVPGTMFPSTVPSTNAIGGTMHSVVLKPDATCAAGSFAVTVKTPSGVTSSFFFNSPAN